MDTEVKIIEKAQDLFLRYGLKSITMDDVSRELGMSKKTLYQFVNNKADLITKVLQAHNKVEKTEMEQIRQEAKNAIDEMWGISRHVNQMLQKINPAIIYDLQKYYHAGWELMRSLRDEFTYKIIRENIERGVQEGLYRPNINADVIAKIYVSRADIIIDQQIFPLQDYTRTGLHEEYITYHMYGILSNRGREVFNDYLKLN